MSECTHTKANRWREKQQQTTLILGLRPGGRGAQGRAREEGLGPSSSNIQKWFPAAAQPCSTNPQLAVGRVWPQRGS